MGSGKTRVLLEVLNQIASDKPVLVVCAKATMPVWVSEIPKWLGIPEDQILRIRGTLHTRRVAWRMLSRASQRSAAGEEIHFRFALVTYDTLRADARRALIPYVPAVVADEAHAVRNRKTKRYMAFERVFRDVPTVIMVSGTPIRHGPQDLWTWLHIVARKAFPSFWRYVGTWTFVDDSEHGGKTITGVRNAAALRDMLRKYLVVIPEAEVSQYLPVRNRISIPLEPSKVQLKAMDDLYANMVAELAGEGTAALLLAPSVLALITRLRQLLASPRILHPGAEVGPAIEFILERLEEDPHCVIFSPFTHALEVMRDEIQRTNVSHSITFLRGGMAEKDQRQQEHEFRTERGTMLCSVQYAQSFSLSTCKQAYFLGYDWSPDVNAQAEDRLRRTDSEHDVVTAYYLQFKGTIDDAVLEALNEKHQNVTMVFARDPTKLLAAVKPRRKV